MPKPRILSTDAESHLGTFGIHQTGFERYENAGVLIEGQRNSDYRWKLTDKKTKQIVQYMTLVEVVNAIKGPAKPEEAF